MGPAAVKNYIKKDGNLHRIQQAILCKILGKCKETTYNRIDTEYLIGEKRSEKKNRD